MLHRTVLRPGVMAALGACMALAMGSGIARAQVRAEESLRKLKPAEGLEATLWAQEPMISNPTNMDIDSRGRIWITEGLNYRLHRNRNREVSRQDEADRIKILEDTDGDGKADKVTVFADHIFPVPMGIAVEEHYGKDGKYQGCKVYVGNSPDLLVFEDTNGDDRADKRYPLLTGFGGIDSDHGVHGMVLGLDGKLYFTHGDGCCSVQQDHSERVLNFDVVDKSGRHVSSDQLANTLRANRDGTQFETLADRQRNNYETSLNAFGNIFTSDNDDDGNRGSRVIWVMDGGHYGYRTPGSPRHWGEDLPGNVPKLVGTGNGSPCGIMVYEGHLLPKEYFGGVFEADAGTRQINFFPITRKGAAFRTEYKVLLGSDDAWFRPVDMAAAPDGSIFVVDWYDAGVGGHAFRDQTTGRVYRVAPKGRKTEKITYDFATIPGLIEALKAPVVATQDAARRSLIARGQEAIQPLETLFARGEPIYRARALWVLHAIQGNRVAEAALKDADPRLREQAVRILGRDVSRNGKVEYPQGQNPPPVAAQAHLSVLLPMANDPDAGVRRELILALRNLPTAEVADALRTLARSWDGQDRWYLEALGLALDKREGSFIAELFDGHLYGDLNLPAAGKATGMALPPYFPIDRNEAFLATGETDRPSSPLTRTLGLAWRVHRAEVLPLLGRIMPQLSSPELQQAADDVLMQVTDSTAADTLAGLVLQTDDAVRKRQLLIGLARGLESSWAKARSSAKVAEVIKTALNDRELRPQGVQLAAATGDKSYGKMLAALAEDTQAPVEVRVAAVEALGAIKPPDARQIVTELISATKEKTSSNPVADAAVRTLPRLLDARQQLQDLLLSASYPLGLRREALRTFAQGQGGRRLLELAEEGKLPGELKTEAVMVLHTHPDRELRQEAMRVLPLPRTSSGRTLPPLSFLLRREGNADRGRSVFFRTAQNSCASCHRVQGRGQWVGPDLSTIGTKYGKDELLRSILNPSAAIGYNYQALTLALNDGRIVTGLPVEQAADRLVLKTAEGQRVSVKTADIEDKKTSDVSLMPEGLAETMTDQELVDLLTFLSTLRQPVSIVGQYFAAGPMSAEEADRLAATTKSIDVNAPLSAANGQSHSWRRLTANAESAVDLTSLLGDDASRSLLLFTPMVSSSDQHARLVLDTRAPLKVWLNGHEVRLPLASERAVREAEVEIPRGANTLLIRLNGGEDVSLVTTIVAAQPIEFSPSEATKSPAR